MDLVSPFLSLKVAKKGTTVARYKPLVVLHAVCQYRSRGSEWVPYDVTCTRSLQRLFERFGLPPFVKTSPAIPFWRLQFDKGVWIVESDGRVRTNRDGNPSSKELIERCARGRFASRKLIRACRNSSSTEYYRLPEQVVDYWFPPELRPKVWKWINSCSLKDVR